MTPTTTPAAMPAVFVLPPLKEPLLAEALLELGGTVTRTVRPGPTLVTTLAVVAVGDPVVDVSAVDELEPPALDTSSDVPVRYIDQKPLPPPISC